MPVQPNESMTKLSHPFTFVCDVPTCIYRTAHKTEAEAFADQSSHTGNRCPQVGQRSYMLDEFDERGQQYTAIHMAKNVGEKLWDELDRALDELLSVNDYLAVDGVSGDRKAHLLAEQGPLKGSCRAFATCIQYLQTLYYPVVDDVTREAVKRRKIRRGELPFEPTPGYNFNPPPLGSKAYETALKRNAGEVVPDKPVRKGNITPATPAVSLSEETDAKLANALKTGLFTDADLATSFHVPEAYIRALRERS